MSFKRLDPEDVLISADSITAPAWTDNLVSLTTFYTSSGQAASASGDFYLDVYQTGSQDDTAEVQFTVGYGDYLGSGSISFDNSSAPGYTPSLVNYNTYRNLILADKSATSKFKFQGGSAGATVESEFIYIINIERSRFKEHMLPTTFELTLISGSEKLVLRNEIPSSLTFNDAGRVYNIISGSLSDSTDLTPTALKTESGSFGLFQPDIGVIILNGQALHAPTAGGGLGLAGTPIAALRTSNTDTSGSQLLFNHIVEGASFKLSSDETVSSNYVFVRARNNEFNYSANPSILTGSGDLKYSYLIDNPRTYITSVGLYNDNNDLLAVAKLSRPLLKDSTREALIRVKLDY